MNRIYWILIFVIALTFGCNNSTDPIDDEPDQPDYLVVAEDYDAGIRIEVCSDDTIKMGYTELYIALFDSATNAGLNDVSIAIKPMMHMSMHSHSAPFEQIDVQKENGYWPCSVVFIMAGDWEIEVEFTDNTNQVNGKIILPLTVLPSDLTKKVMGQDSMSYFISMIEPRNPEVGMNTFEISVHKKESMMSFPAQQDFAVEMEPSMPSMGHGSPNNENPVHKTKGHYQGKVNFTMTGDWRIDLRLSRGNSLTAETHFDLMLD